MTRRKTVRKPTEADLRKPIEYEEHYDRTTPLVTGGHIQGVVMYADDQGVVAVRWATEADAQRFPHDVRQTDQRKLYADRRQRFEAARKPGVAIPLPEYGEPEGVDNP